MQILSSRRGVERIAVTTKEYNFYQIIASDTTLLS